MGNGLNIELVHFFDDSSTGSSDGNSSGSDAS
jgi:hypothetical protein